MVSGVWPGDVALIVYLQYKLPVYSQENNTGREIK